MKLNVLVYMILLFAFIVFAQYTRAENIHFNNDIYTLKNINFSEINKGYENEYYVDNNKENNSEKMIGIYYYPEIKNPIKFAENADKEIETRAGVILLKFIANKKQNKAILSFIDAGEDNGKPFIEHNIYKYEPHPKKGMMLLRYTKKYYTNNNEDITNAGTEIKNLNDDLIEQIIISPIPPIIEKITRLFNKNITSKV